MAIAVVTESTGSSPTTFNRAGAVVWRHRPDESDERGEAGLVLECHHLTSALPNMFTAAARDGLSRPALG